MVNPSKKGFTLIELIIVVAIIAILASAAYVAINPAKRIGEANNAKRWADVTAILNAVLAYVADNNGNFPAALNGSNAGITAGIGTSAGGCSDTTVWNGTSFMGCGNSGNSSYQATDITSGINACVDLTSALVDTYLPTIPQDPVIGPFHASWTGYYIYRSQPANRVTVGACFPYVNAVSNVIRVAR